MAKSRTYSEAARIILPFLLGTNTPGINRRNQHGGVSIDELVMRNELLVRNISERAIGCLQIADKEELAPHSNVELKSMHDMTICTIWGVSPT